MTSHSTLERPTPRSISTLKLGSHLRPNNPYTSPTPLPELLPWLQPADLEVVQTGAWIRPDERPFPADLEAFLDAGAAPVLMGFGSMPMRDSQDVAKAAIEAVRAKGCRSLLSRGWAELALTYEQDGCFTVGEVNQQALFARVARGLESSARRGRTCSTAAERRPR